MWVKMTREGHFCYVFYCTHLNSSNPLSFCVCVYSRCKCDKSKEILDWYDQFWVKMTQGTDEGLTKCKEVRGRKTIFSYREGQPCFYTDWRKNDKAVLEWLFVAGSKYMIYTKK